MFEAVSSQGHLGWFESGEGATAAEELAALMSEISERCYYAAWEGGIEEVLWQALTYGPTNWGHDRITTDDIARLRELSSRCAGWIKWTDSDSSIRFVPVSEWKARDLAQVQILDNPYRGRPLVR
jgi:hypothetical protein